MKKYILILVAVVAIAGFTGCTKTEVIERVEPISYNRTVRFNILANDWEPNDNNTVWGVSYQTDLIDDLIMDHGTVQVDISFDNGVVFEPLTTVFDRSGYRFDYSLGELLIDVQSTEGTNPIERPGAAIVKMILVDSDPI